MKRRQVSSGAATLGLALTTVAAPAVAQSMPERHWRLALGFPRSLLFGTNATLEVKLGRVLERADQLFAELFEVVLGQLEEVGQPVRRRGRRRSLADRQARVCDRGPALARHSLLASLPGQFSLDLQRFVDPYRALALASDGLIVL